MRSLRRREGWSQATLAAHLGLSQSRLSQVERGEGSFKAEQLIVLLGLFNVDLTRFLPPPTPDGELQNALIRFGARHLREVPGTPDTGRYLRPGDVLLGVLIEAPWPRFITALAPVLIAQPDTGARGVSDGCLRKPSSPSMGPHRTRIKP